MLYPVYVYPGNETTAHAAVFPDFPGCHAAADEWERLPAAINEAVQAHFFGEQGAVPAPSALQSLAGHPDYEGGAWLLAEVDLTRIDAKPIRLNVSMPANVVQQIDAWADAHGMTRSGFLAEAARAAMHPTRR